MRARATVAVLAGVYAAAGLPAAASAHVERPGYWPDPAPDRSVTPSAGGRVPTVRSLGSALIRSRPGTTRVVCQPDSMARLDAAIARARRSGYELRPTDRRRFSVAYARRLLRVNRGLWRMCRFREIQPAVTASGNQDRVVIMPGVYTEPTSRAKPTNDPRCAGLRTRGDRPGQDDALSYAYQVTCPNDQNLVAVIGRTVSPTPDLVPPRWDRHGIPNPGRCIRCNVQIEGSGVGPDDVVLEGGDASKGNGGPSGVGAKKDVGLRADRADGFVLRNVTIRHTAENAFYVMEADGYVVERFKGFYNLRYGILSFMEDHGVIRDCDVAGNGDSGLYPGSPVDSGVQRPPGTDFRYNQEVTRCDMHHNLAGYSATAGNAVHVHHNEVYDNTMGLNTDVITAAGHPGYPGDSMLFERNNIYSNNFNPYRPGSDVPGTYPYPVGTGMWIAGGNHHVLRHNRIYDNWRRGVMLFAVPDALQCGPRTGNRQAGCDESKVSVSHYNAFHDNTLGIAPDGSRKPNGTDFWWDSFPGNRGNCWFRNRGPGGPVTTSPSPLPDCADGQDPATSVGTGNPANEGELIACVVAYETDTFDPAACPWFATPPRPGTAAAARARHAQDAELARAFRSFCAPGGPGPEATCAPYAGLL